MNVRVTFPTRMSHLVFGLIVFILLLSALVIVMNHPIHAIPMPSIMNDSSPALASASQARSHPVPVPTPPMNASLRQVASTPVPASNQPIPVPQPVPTPPSDR